MRVKEFMQVDVITVSSQDSIYDALKILKEKNFRRIPVVDNEKLVGIVTRQAIRDASPSKATTLSVHELNYLLSKMTVADVMKKNVMTTSQNTPIEEAGLIMHKHRIGGLPVMEGKKMIGYISSNDIFRAIVKINGLDQPVARIGLEINANEWQKAIAACTGVIFEAECDFKISSLMNTEDEGKKRLVFRFKDNGQLDSIVEKIKKLGFNVVSVIKNVQMS